MPVRHPLAGLGLATLGYALFAVQDVLVKLLVARFSVPEVLLSRSLIIMAIAGVIGGPGALRGMAASRNKVALLARAGLILAAWLSYYTASRDLGLAELTTLYFAAPIIVVILSVVILRERVTALRWSVVTIGFAGVAIAAGPAGTTHLVPVALVLVAAVCWSLSVILVRLISRSETTASQMLVSNALFAIACAACLPWVWRTPDLEALLLMGGLGIAGGLGQYVLFEGFRLAPASAVAPIEYTGLVWAFLYGYLIWADVPDLRVFVGAAFIVGSCLALLWVERRRARPNPA